MSDEEYLVCGEVQVPTSLRPGKPWYLAHRLPGAVRYRSFRDLMNDERRQRRLPHDAGTGAAAISG